MTTTDTRRLTLFAGAAWLVVAGCGVERVLSGNADGWPVAYTVLTVTLLLATTTTVAAASSVSRRSDRPRTRIAGLVVCGLGCAVIAPGAWALPVWMTLLGVGFALVGVASGTPGGRFAAVLATAQFAAIVVLIGGIEAQVGRRDEYGDYPMAGGIALVVVAGLTVAGIIGLVRAADRFDKPVAVPSG